MTNATNNTIERITINPANWVEDEVILNKLSETEFYLRDEPADVFSFGERFTDEGYGHVTVETIIVLWNGEEFTRMSKWSDEDVWVAGGSGITREDKDPMIAVAKLICNIV